MKSIEEKSVQRRHQDADGNWWISGHEERPDGTKDSLYTRKACPPNTKMVFGKCRQTQKTRWKEQQAQAQKVEGTMSTMRQILREVETHAIAEADTTSPCSQKYVDPDTGRFKGGKGERFDNCVEYMKCKGDVDDPEAVCGQIARARQRARGESIGEAVNAAVVDRMAQAMLDSPKLVPIAGRVLDDEQMEMFSGLMLEPLRALIAKALDVSGVAVSGGLLSKAGREMKSAARGDIGAE
jgi:hypothetical protein